MERKVWRILRGIARCEREDLGFGHAGVRLDYKRGEEPIARIYRPSRFKSAVDLDAVYDCVGDALTSTPTRLNPSYMVVSFRFKIRPLP
jgi:hypothetical protein